MLAQIASQRHDGGGIVRDQSCDSRKWTKIFPDQMTAAAVFHRLVQQPSPSTREILLSTYNVLQGFSLR
jgi:hypothetical protein